MLLGNSNMKIAYYLPELYVTTNIRPDLVLEAAFQAETETEQLVVHSGHVDIRGSTAITLINMYKGMINTRNVEHLNLWSDLDQAKFDRLLDSFYIPIPKIRLWSSDHYWVYTYQGKPPKNYDSQFIVLSILLN